MSSERDDVLRRVLDYLPAMTAYWDATFQCVFANRAFEDWLGLPPESLIGRHAYDVFGDTIFREGLPFLEAVLRGESQELERDIVDRTTGRVRRGLVSSVPDVDANGVVRGFFVLVTDVSAMKRAEKALVASEKRFAGIVDIAADAIISVDEDGRISLFNQGAEAIFQWQRAQVIGQPLDVLLPERFRTHVRAFVESGATSQQAPVDRTDLAGLRKDGSEFAAEASLSRLVLDDDDDATGVRRRRTIVTVSLRDVSERTKAEAERAATLDRLRESEERQRVIIDEAPIGKAIVDLDGHFVRVNKALCELVGYTRAELEGGLTFQSITHKDDVADNTAAFHAGTRGELPRYRAEKRYVRKDGSIVPVRVNAVVLRDREGRATAHMAQIEDLSEQKRAEDDQRFLAELGTLFVASSLDLESTLKNLADVAVRHLADFCNVEVLDDDNELRRVAFASRPDQRVIAEVLARFPLDRTRPRPLRQAFDNKRTIVMREVTPATILEWAESDEHLKAMFDAGIASCVIVPLVAHDHALGVIVLTLTTASQRRFDDHDVRLAEDLARSAALAIENARLYRAAQRATQARDDMLGIVAHDLRNPLSTIVMQAGVLRRATATPERAADDVRALAARCADVVGRAAKRMERLISDLFDVTRLETGRMLLEPVIVSPRALVSDTCEAHRGLAMTSGIEIVVDVAPELPEIRADRDRVLQALENLVGNALKFTPTGGKITLRARAVDEFVMFAVADTGEGVAPEDLPHLFDRFRSGRSKRRGGAGLGLSIVKGVIEAHGGHVFVDSVPGCGSTFSFTLPAVRAPAHEPVPAFT